MQIFTMRYNLEFRKLTFYGLTRPQSIRKSKQISGKTILSSAQDLELRWLDTVFQGQYLPSLSINYVAMNKVLEKLPPQLY